MVGLGQFVTGPVPPGGCVSEERVAGGPEPQHIGARRCAETVFAAQRTPQPSIHDRCPLTIDIESRSPRRLAAETGTSARRSDQSFRLRPAPIRIGIPMSKPGTSPSDGSDDSVRERYESALPDCGPALERTEAAPPEPRPFGSIKRAGPAGEPDRNRGFRQFSPAIPPADEPTSQACQPGRQEQLDCTDSGEPLGQFIAQPVEPPHQLPKRALKVLEVAG